MEDIEVKVNVPMEITLLRDYPENRKWRVSE